MPAFLALMGFVFILHSAAWGIAEWLPVWAGYLIVAVVVLIVAAVLGLLGKKALDNARPAPERAIEQAQQTIAVIKSTGSEPATPAGATGATAHDRHDGHERHDRARPPATGTTNGVPPASSTP